MPDKTPFHRCTAKRCLRCWQNRQRHARGKKDGPIKPEETVITGSRDDVDELKQFELELRQAVTGACHRLKNLDNSIGILNRTMQEDMPKWKRDTLSRAEQHLVNCAKTYERLCALKKITDEDAVEEMLQRIESEYQANELEQKVPPFKSKLPIKDQDIDVEKLVRLYGTKKVTIF